MGEGLCREIWRAGTLAHTFKRGVMGCVAYMLQAGSGVWRFPRIRTSGYGLPLGSGRRFKWLTELELLLTFTNDGTFDGTFFSAYHIFSKYPMRSPLV